MGAIQSKRKLRIDDRSVRKADWSRLQAASCFRVDPAFRSLPACFLTGTSSHAHITHHVPLVATSHRKFMHSSFGHVRVRLPVHHGGTASEI
jgi:hypothetical protein